MKNRKFIFILSVFVILALIATGCRVQERPAPRPAPEPAPRENAMDRNGEDDQNMRDNREMAERNTPGNVKPGEGNRNEAARARQIEKQVVKLKEVENATVVVSENTAVVGVNLVDNMNGRLTTGVRRKIENVVKETDEDVHRVSVTADPDLYKRIQSLARDAANGRAVSGFGTQVEDLVRRITPTT